MLRLKVEENLSKYNPAQPRTRVSGAILYILEYFKHSFFSKKKRATRIKPRGVTQLGLEIGTGLVLVDAAVVYKTTDFNPFKE